MSDSIHFPSASSQSKLSAALSTKVPQSTNWIYQDVYNSTHHDPEYLMPPPTIDLCRPTTSFQMTSSLFEACKIVTHDSRYSGWDTQLDYTFCPTSFISDNRRTSVYNQTSSFLDSTAEDNDSQSIDPSSAPVLIESTFSSSTTTSSTAESIQSFRCSHTTEMMAVGGTLKKRKSTSSFRSLKSFIHAISPTKKPKLNPTAKKFFQFFKR